MGATPMYCTCEHGFITLKPLRINDLILSQAVNSMHINVSKIGIFYSEKLPVIDTIYIFTVAKQGFLGNFGTGIFYQKVLSEGYLSEITLRML